MKLMEDMKNEYTLLDKGLGVGDMAVGNGDSFSDEMMGCKNTTPLGQMLKCYFRLLSTAQTSSRDSQFNPNTQM